MDQIPLNLRYQESFCKEDATRTVLFGDNVTESPKFLEQILDGQKQGRHPQASGCPQKDRQTNTLLYVMFKRLHTTEPRHPTKWDSSWVTMLGNPI